MSSILPRTLTKISPLQKPIQAWVETLAKSGDDMKLGIVNLHPRIFAISPRLDILARNVYWQSLYSKIVQILLVFIVNLKIFGELKFFLSCFIKDYSWAPTRAEIQGRNKKPWQQKGLGKARHGSRLSPQWMGGGVAHGPRGPKSYYFMEGVNVRVLGLRTALTVKFHQNDLHIVDNLEIPHEDPQVNFRHSHLFNLLIKKIFFFLKYKYLQDLVEAKHWGPSVLFIDE